MTRKIPSFLPTIPVALRSESPKISISSLNFGHFSRDCREVREKLVILKYVVTFNIWEWVIPADVIEGVDCSEQVHDVFFCHVLVFTVASVHKMCGEGT